MGTKKTVCLLRSNTHAVFMEAISKELEERLDEMKDKYGEIHYYTKDNIKVPGTSVFAYGTVDLDDINDLNFIDNLNIINPEPWLPYLSVIHTSFDYDKGTITSDERGIFKITQTWNKLKWFKYNYCLIGKPKRIIIYEINKFWYKNK